MVSHHVRDLDVHARAITGRAVSAFDDAVAELGPDVRATFRGARVLVTGGAGFIGGQTLRLLLALEPAVVVVADTWENGLAELVRDLRSEGAIPDVTRFEPRLVDVTGPLVERVVHDDGPFDVVLAFAAAKHVRTERDPVSALHMLDVNITGTLRTLRAVAAANPQARLFMVSTDKAADPSSLMGASKRVMEEAVRLELPQVTTTRFANVAFSSGSLLESWLIRLARGQALPVPADTSRFFVSPVEAGQICLLAAVADPGAIVVPRPGVVESVDLQDALHRMLDGMGLPYVTVDAQGAVGTRDDEVRILVTERDTAGEKASEVFVGAGETSRPWLPALDVVRAGEPRPECLEVAAWVTKARGSLPGPDVAEIVSRVGSAVPEFAHVASTRRLDDRI
jgi:FlaA1/EpsC-like NDP-sugar epimerase